MNLWNCMGHKHGSHGHTHESHACLVCPPASSMGSGYDPKDASHACLVCPPCTQHGFHVWSKGCLACMPSMPRLDAAWVPSMAREMRLAQSLPLLNGWHASVHGCYTAPLRHLLTFCIDFYGFGDQFENKADGCSVTANCSPSLQLPIFLGFGWVFVDRSWPADPPQSNWKNKVNCESKRVPSIRQEGAPHLKYCLQCFACNFMF